MGPYKYIKCVGHGFLKLEASGPTLCEHLLRCCSDGINCLYGFLGRPLPPTGNTDTALLVSCGHWKTVFWTNKPLVVSWISLFRWTHAHPSFTQQQQCKYISGTRFSEIWTKVPATFNLYPWWVSPVMHSYLSIQTTSHCEALADLELAT